ncbi:MAG TPA: hypothetical protein PKN44_10065 [Bacteroidales bacterium]|nr:hypothetical protein [Bacteroidales bacterium]
MKTHAFPGTLLRAYQQYVNHADIIHRRGKPELYRRLDRLDALQRCVFYSKWMIGKSNLTVAKVILAREQDLWIILPDQSNLSYRSSCINLLKLIELSNELIEQKLKYHEN